MESMGRKKPRPRRAFTPEFKAEIVELQEVTIRRPTSSRSVTSLRCAGRAGSAVLHVCWPDADQDLGSTVLADLRAAAGRHRHDSGCSDLADWESRAQLGESKRGGCPD